MTNKNELTSGEKTSGENKDAAQGRARDYSHEYIIRKKRNSRIYADIDKNKAQAIKARLLARGVTFAAWLNDCIDNELGQDVTEADALAAIKKGGLYFLD